MNKATLVVKPGSQEIQVTRDFDAPRDLVYKAMTDPELISQWWGQASSVTRVDRMEARPGGIWRFLEMAADGNVYPFFGVYHQVSPEQIVYTFEFEGMPGHVSLETARLEELPGGKTRLHVITVFQSVEDRDGMVQEGMERGMNESYERLDRLLAQKINA